MKNWLKLAVILLGLVLTSCASLSVPNEEACIRLQRGAACTYTLDGPERDFTEKQWEHVRIGRVSFDYKSYGEIRKFIEQACEKDKDCELKKVKKRLDHVEYRLRLGGHP